MPIHTPKRNVLFVEDRAPIIRPFKQIIDTCFGSDISFDISTSFEEANEKLSQAKYNLIILGTHYSHQDLISQRGAIRASRRNSDSSVILLDNRSYVDLKEIFQHFDWIVSDRLYRGELVRAIEIFSRFDSFTGSDLAFVRTPTAILILDDDADMVSHHVGLIRSIYGHTLGIETVGNGNEAIRKINSKTYDLILADLVHPGANGIEVAEYARGSIINHGTPLLLITLANYTIWPEWLWLLFDFCLEKSITKIELARMVRMLAAGELPILPHLVRQPYLDMALQHPQEERIEKRNGMARASRMSAGDSQDRTELEKQAKEKLAEFDMSLKKRLYRHDGD